MIGFPAGSYTAFEPRNVDAIAEASGVWTGHRLACMLVGVLRAAVFFLGLLAVAAGLAACFGNDDDGTAPPTPTPAPPAATAPPEARPTATQAPPPLPTSPSGGMRVPKTVWLVDVAATSMRRLAEDFESFALSARFTEDGTRVQLAVNTTITEHDLNGNELGPAPDDSSCEYIEQGEQINGRWHPSVNCDSPPLAPLPFFSPDGRWFTYRLADAAATPVFPPISEMWALDLQTGARQLLHEMQDCGGCDARFGPAWSPSGRYYVFAETGGEGRVFLSDLEAGSTRHIANGNEIPDQPEWAPNEDVLLYKSAEARVAMEDLPAETMQVLDNLAWPAAFDPSGEVIYTRSFVPPDKDPAPVTTTFVRTSALDTTSQLDGGIESLTLFRDNHHPVVGTPAIVAALAGASGCDGVQIYAAGDKVTCILDGRGATISPDGAKVAVARITGTTGLVSYPGGGSVSLNVFEIVVINVKSGAETVVASDAVSDQPPIITWNEGASHLIVEWPAFAGL
jgi:WD40 repeat protein